MFRATALMSALALGQALPASAQADDTRVVTGSIGYLQRIALPNEARAVVAAEGRFGVLLGEVMLDPDGRQVPLPFEMTVPSGLAGVVGAVIRVHGKARWVLKGLTFEAGRDPVTLGELTLVPVTPLAFATDFICGDTPVSIGVLDNVMILRVEGHDIRLEQVRAASGAKYGAVNDPTTSVWNKGRTFMVQLEGHDLAECRKVPPPEDMPYRAQGNEPGWAVQFDADTVRISVDYGAFEQQLLRPGVRVQAGAYVFDMPQADARLRIEDTLCRDSATGMPHPNVARLTLGDRTLSGCGGAPLELLMGQGWQVNAIKGDPVIDPSRVALNFVGPERVAGSTGCNRLVGGYTLTGEGLSFGPAGNTMMACEDPLMEQERRMMDALEQVRRFDIAEDGSLLLIGGPDDEVLLNAAQP